MTELTLTRPDDWHLHLRDGPALARTVTDACRNFGRAIVMPNLTPPVTGVAQAHAYRERILAQRPAGSDWQPLMTLYLTDHTQARDIAEASASEHVYAAKLYPAGATTNSAAGVTLPMWSATAPIVTVRAMRFGNDGSRWSARAMLVSGPSVV